MYAAFYHYTRQTDYVLKRNQPYPILCDIPYFYKYLNNGENKHATTKWGEVDIGGTSFNGTCIMFPNYEPFVVINDVKIVEQLYTTHNALFDKHPLIQNLTLKLTGRSILFDESSKNWR